MEAKRLAVLTLLLVIGTTVAQEPATEPEPEPEPDPVFGPCDDGDNGGCPTNSTCLLSSEDQSLVACWCDDDLVEEPTIVWLGDDCPFDWCLDDNGGCADLCEMNFDEDVAECFCQVCDFQVPQDGDECPPPNPCEGVTECSGKKEYCAVIEEEPFFECQVCVPPMKANREHMGCEFPGRGRRRGRRSAEKSCSSKEKSSSESGSSSGPKGRGPIRGRK